VFDGAWHSTAEAGGFTFDGAVKLPAMETGAGDFPEGDLNSKGVPHFGQTSVWVSLISFPQFTHCIAISLLAN
jgi:hypothetical protein